MSGNSGGPIGPGDLTEFLFARLSEDAAAAQAVLDDMPRWDDPDWERSALEVGGSLPGPQHSARWSPARVLAECVSKRRVVYANCGGADDRSVETMRWLAHPYADHPDYRQEWTP